MWIFLKFLATCDIASLTSNQVRIYKSHFAPKREKSIFSSTSSIFCFFLWHSCASTLIFLVVKHYQKFFDSLLLHYFHLNLRKDGFLTFSSKWCREYQISLLLDWSEFRLFNGDLWISPLLLQFLII